MQIRSSQRPAITSESTDPAALRDRSSLVPGNRVAGAVPFLIAVGASLACYYLLLNRGLGLPIVGYNISPAERLMNGEAPYRDFIYNYTPGVLWTNAALMRLFGTTIITVNWGLLAFKVATILVLFQIGRRLASAWQALIPVCLTLAWIGYNVVFRAYPTQYSLLFILLGLVCILNFDRSEKLVWLSLCGASIGVVFSFKQNVGIYLVLLISLSIVLREWLKSPAGVAVHLSRRVARRLLVYWIGFAVVAGATLGCIAYTGAFGPMLQHFFSFGSEYVGLRAVALPNPKLLMPVVVGSIIAAAVCLLAIRLRPVLFEPLLLSLLAVFSVLILIPGRGYLLKRSATATVSYLPAILIIIAICWFAWRVKRTTRKRDERNKLWHQYGSLVVVALFSLGTYLEMFPRADYAHLVRILPPIFLLFTLLLASFVPELIRFLETRVPHPRRAAILCAAVPVIALFVIGIKDAWQPRFHAGLHFIDSVPLNLDRARGVLVSRKQANFVQELAKTIEENSSPEDYIFSFAPRGTAFYFLSARRNPTRFVWWRSVGLGAAERQSLREMIAGGIPKLVIVSDKFRNQAILEALATRYRMLHTVRDIVLYEKIM